MRGRKRQRRDVAATYAAPIGALIIRRCVCCMKEWDIDNCRCLADSCPTCRRCSLCCEGHTAGQGVLAFNSENKEFQYGHHSSG